MTDRTKTPCMALLIGWIWLAAPFPSFPSAAEQPAGQKVARPQPAQRAVAGPFLQFGVQRGLAQAEPNLPQIFLPLRRDLKRVLSQAQTALKEERYSDAVTALDALLNGPEVDDYFIASTPMGGTRTSLKARVRQLLGAMPVQGREAYELQFGAEARRLLEGAIQAGDAEQLTDVSRRYFHTRAGDEATLLAAHYSLNQGRPLAAAILLQRFDQAPHTAKDFEPELSLLLAVCWRCANVPKAAEETLLDLARRFPNATFTLRGEKVSMFDRTALAAESDVLTWLDELIGTPHLAQRSEMSEWPLYRGDPSRNATSEGGMPLLQHRWRVPTANDWGDEQEVLKWLKRYVDRGVPALPGLHPLALGDVVLMRSPRELLAVDFDTGKRIWLYPWDKDLANLAADDSYSRRGVNLAPAWTRGQPNRRELELHQRVWEDAAYGQISSDGSSVFLLDELDYASVPGLVRPQVVPRAFGGFNATSRSNNRLVALDLKTQGKLQWAVGRGLDGDPGDDPRLADAFFLGPPLPLSGRLYILAEIHGEVRLLVLDSRTGHLEWSQQLAHFEAPQHAITYHTVRRLAAATPSFADGILVCPISSGAVVALDMATRSLRWGYQYRTHFSQRSNRVRRWPRGVLVPSQLKPAGTRWADATTTIADGRVLVTPVESDHLHCLDLVTGEPVWPPQQRGENLFVACVHKGLAVLVGKNHVSAIRMTDGKAAWKQPLELPSSAMPSGRGFLSGGHYYLPTTAPDLVKIDVRKGTFEAVHMDFMLGNLVCHRGQIVAQGAQWLEAFYQTDRLQALVQQRLEENPEDPWALEHQAMLLINQGQPGEALQPLRRALQLYPADAARRDAAQALLVRTLLDALREDFSANHQLAAEVDKLIDQPEQRDEYLRLMAGGLHKSGHHARAFELYLEIAQSHVARARLGKMQLPSEGMQNSGRDLRVQHDRWLREVFHELLGVASDADRFQMLAKIESLLESALQDKTVIPLRNLLAHFGSHPVMDVGRVRLAERLIAHDQLLRAELMLKPLTESRNEATAASAVALTARLLTRAHRTTESTTWYRLLASRYGNVTNLDGKTGQQIVESLSDAKVVAPALEQFQWPHGRVLIEERKSDSRRTGRSDPFAPSSSPPHPISIRQFDHSLPAGTRLILSPQRNSIGMIDSFGKLQQFVRLEQPRYGQLSRDYRVTYAKMLGRLLIVSFGSEIVAIDTLTPKAPDGDVPKGGNGMEVLWRVDLGSHLPGIPSSQRRVRPTPRSTPWGTKHFVASGQDGKPTGVLGTVSDQGICYQVGRELRCVDPHTNQPFWIRNAVAAGSTLFGDDRHVFAQAPGSTTARVFSRIDGQEEGQRPVPRVERQWMTLGRRILTWDDPRNAQSPITLRLYDPWTRRNGWSHEFAYGSMGWLIEDDEVGIMQPDGRFVLIGLQDGRKKIDAQLEPEKSLVGIYVARYADQYLLVTNARSLPQSTTITNIPASDSVTRGANGRVYAFDRESGEPLWPVPAVVENYGIPLYQPTDVPVVTFLRNTMSRARNRSRQQRASVLCLDRRDGRLLLEKENLPRATSYDIQADPENHTVTVSLYNSTTFRLQFTDEPRAPEPPAQTGQASSVARRAGGSRLAKLAGAIAAAFGRESSPVPQGSREPQVLRKRIEQSQPKQSEQPAKPQAEAVGEKP